jgi:4-hydroxybenzoate polyprenyltransferase/phosphoserine phosphatase
MLDTPKPPVATAKPPLAVDLDGTLIHCDVFIEAMLQLVFHKPWKLLQLVAWLMRGRAFAKAQLAQEFPPDVTRLPYDERLVAWVREEHAAGRTVALATASDRRAAQLVADHIGAFDAVFASDGHTNLKSRRKGEALTAAYPQGFAYAGNEHADLKVWSAAAQAVVVNANPILQRQAAKAFQVEKTFPPQHTTLGAIAKAIRPQQWAKNLLVFVPMLAGQGWFSAEAWQHAFLAFLALSATASGLYLINDIADIAADRRHPRKRKRPFASGAATPVLGLPVALALLITGAGLGSLAGALAPLAVYAATSALYTFWLKRVALIDVFVLAGLYTLRIVLGGIATGFAASDWLLAFSGFFFLSLALVKRASEVDSMQADLVGRGYRMGDSPMLKRIGVGAGMIAALVLALYLQEPANQARYAAPAFLWVLPGVVVFWLSRVWLKVERGEMHDDPLMFAFHDRLSWVVFGLGALAFAAAALW